MDEKGLLQIKIYTRKFFRTLKKESLISIIIGIVITFIVMMVTEENLFRTFEGTKSGLFSLICVCIWIGIFNSIQLVCREKNDIVKDELDKSLKASSYMAAHFIYQFVLCFIQSLIVFFIFMLFVEGKIGFRGSPIEYFITIFLVMYASDAMSFVLSAAVPTPIVAMTFMPLLLLIQLVMAGVLFELKGFSSDIASLTISKWGMTAFGKIGNITSLPSAMEDSDRFGDVAFMIENWISDADIEKYGSGATDQVVCWVYFILFIIVFFALSIFALKMTTRKINK